MTLPILVGERVSILTRTLQMAVAVVRSPYNGASQAQDWGGRWWSYELQFGPWRGAESRAARAFAVRLEETAGRFLFQDPTAAYTGGVEFPGDPLVAGLGQTGRTLVTDGWTPGIPIFAGMCFSLGTDTATRFHMVTTDTIVNDLGQATLTIAPPLRESPADNAVIEWAEPKVQLRVSSGVASQIAAGAYTTFSFSAEEVL
jgi:hypothetical protein